MKRLSLARWLLHWTLPPDEREQIVDELDEVQAAKFPAGGLRAWTWYWRQATSFSLYFLAERYHEASRDASVGSARNPASVADEISKASASRRAALGVDASPGGRSRHLDSDDSGPTCAPHKPRSRKESTMRGDVGYALRQLVKQPGFTFVVVFTLALGIGPNTAIFSVVNGVLLQPLPYDHPEELALLRIDLSGLTAHPGLAQAEVADFRRESTLLAGLGVVTREQTLSLTAEGNMEAVLAARVSPNLFPLLGIDPLLGRHFTEEEGVFPTHVEGEPLREEDFPQPVAILSHGLWQRRYSGDPEVINQDIEVNGRAIPIAGIMPEGFRLLLGPGTSLSPDVDLWLPFVMDTNHRGFWAYRTIARLKPGKTFEQAQAEIDALGAAIVLENAEAYAGTDIRFYVRPLHSDLVQNVRPAILALVGAVSLVLLIACTNAASLLLARTKTREKEIAVRAALGAGRTRIMRQVLTESVVLALLAGGLGLILGAFGLKFLLAMQPGNLPRVDEIGLDRTVLGFTLGASFLAALLFGVIPAWKASRPQMQEALKAGGRSGGSVMRGHTRSFLVAAEVAFSVMLLIGAGLLIRTFYSLTSVDLGFQPESVITMKAPLDGREFDPDQRWLMYQQLRERVEALPGVRAAGAISILPLSNQNMMASYAFEEGQSDVETNWNGTNGDYRFVTPGYFEAMGTRIIAGRAFDGRDNEGLQSVAIIDRTLAEEAFPDDDPLGRYMQIGLGTQLNQDDEHGEDVLGNNPVQIVGVVEHVRGIDVRREVRPQIYLPYRLGPSSDNILAVRAEGDPSAVVAMIRDEAEALGLGRPIHSVRMMGSLVSDAMGETRFTLILMGALAAIALLLSTVGIYSVIAFLVKNQKFETGIRMALGAQPGDVVRNTVKQGLVLAAIGVPVGLAGAFVLTRFIEGLLFGVAATDPATFVGIPVLLVSVALLASYVPARRASRVDPLVALRSE